jgi:hypothetical protein
MCDLAGGVIAVSPEEGPAAQIAQVALARVGEASGARIEATLRDSLEQRPANVRPGPHRERRHPASLPYHVQLITVEQGAEISFVDEVRREYLDLVVNHPELIPDLANRPAQRLAVAPNWRLHQAAVQEAVADPFVIGANHQTYLIQMNFTTPTISPADPVVVAVLDNGFDDKWWSGAPSPVPVGNGMDLLPNDSGSSGHGTLVSALIAETAPGAVIEPIRMGGDDSTEWDALHALARAVEIEASVIALSYRQVLVDTPCGTCGLVRKAARSEVFERLLDWAKTANGANRAIVVAAGNDGVGIVANPAAYSSAIPVTALDTSGAALASFANWDPSGALPVIALPGDDVAINTNTNADIEGTSFATAYAAAMYAEGMMRWGNTDEAYVTGQLVSGGGGVSNAHVAVLP